jgi:hypothetical protein
MEVTNLTLPALLVKKTLAAGWATGWRYSGSSTWVLPLAVGSSASLAHFWSTVRYSSSFLGQADTPAWQWLFAGGSWPVAFHHTVWDGLVTAKLCLQEGSRHWTDIAEGADAAGGNNWVECGQKLRAR